MNKISDIKRRKLFVKYWKSRGKREIVLQNLENQEKENSIQKSCELKVEREMLV